ncbi:hypothetical protein DMA11_17575 [Marinilabiliaceae bacterium JC017]|nr:hypothetical protein DMA11_17575 [Marinilabiliaceae bacterium JC017]
MHESVIRSIDKANLCIGCGLCEAICGKENVKMNIESDGFIHPKLLNSRVKKKDGKIISKICPAVNVRNSNRLIKSEKVWGTILGCYSTYSTSKEVRNNGSSGGTITQICISLLKSGKVDAVLQVGGSKKDYSKNELKVNKTEESILECASSRYAPAFVFPDILKLLSGSDEKYAFVGKPCDVTALKNLLVQFPQYAEKIKYTIAIVCAGIPSFIGTDNVIKKLKAVSPVSNLRYRGDGWPGYFSFQDAKGEKHKMSYNESWGKILGKTVHIRCKICPDGIGFHSDIAVGDDWETKDGYPDFNEKPGQSLTITRSNKGEELIEELTKSGELSRSEIAISKLKVIQPYQYKRRIYVAARILAFMLVKGRVLNFRNMGVMSNVVKVNGYIFVREFLGSMKRFIRRR